MHAPALTVKDLALSSGTHQLVHPLTFSVNPGESVALLGASGSGKSLTAAALCGSLPDGISATGEITLAARQGTAKAALIGQDPASSLNPFVSVGRQLALPLRRAGRNRAEAKAEAAGFLVQAGLEDPAEILARYSGELSGGQLQRVCIALALACHSTILIADEPTTALDAVTQRKVLATLGAWGAEGRSLLFITHDLAAAAALCTRALVMEAGRIVEEAPMADLLRNPQHPYTRRLVQSASRDSLLERVAGTAMAA
ncbi:ABC transporter ATP-binding protein [Pseudarthrobacter phenanthrenivorans]|uniref:ABC transporter ATP-binding protein n=1 Tax=Pseudarthrobacter phenanthrenivorans TaxID=361575 RepID=A0A3B0FQ08_PSEPS|nr:ABC transporter ATP-binding protein [Pseudarthrobacter phenanthrenivorans]RKO23671.1 ABC transporter ATP-binding protein [Pseudarthrobacter phenanthrenivorans]TPV50567.1 ABC transporter ATP-binding protein [Pseudarthrobacter phenanthrenivorans]